MTIDSITALKLVKARLNRLEGDTTLDEYFRARIAAAQGEIESRGIELADNSDDMLLVVDYAVYQYQNRDKTEDYPAWLEHRLRQRYFAQEVAT